MTLSQSNHPIFIIIVITVNQVVYTTTLVALYHYEEMLPLNTRYLSVFYRKSMKFDIQEDQLMLLLETKFSSLPV